MEKHKGGSSKKKKEGNNDEDDEMTLQHSDDEENEDASESPLVEVLKVHIGSLSKLLESATPKDKMQGSFDDNHFVPLGNLRLKLVELFLFVLKLHKQTLYEGMIEATSLANISQLLADYPWNNFL